MTDTIQQVASSPFYYNWSFGAVIIATIALALSQIPPLHLLFKKAKIDIELYSRILVTHKVGNPNLTCHLILNNTGGRTLRVKKIYAKIERDEKPIVTLPAQNYNANPSDKNSILLTSFNIKPQNEWGQTTNFLNYFERAEEKAYKEAEALLKEDILKRLDAEPDRNTVVKADAHLIKAFQDMFNKMFIWEPGEYTLTMVVNADPLKDEAQKQYRFTLFESDSQELKNYTKDYDTGTGIYYDTVERHPGVSIQITENKA